MKNFEVCHFDQSVDLQKKAFYFPWKTRAKTI